MSKCSTVECKCKWCGAPFGVDSRHSHAKNCGSTQCRKDANNEYARRSYHMLKKNNPKAYQEMLNRKKTERLAREERKREEAKQAKQKANPRHVLPRRRNVSNHFICALILAFVGLLIGSSNRSEVVENLQRISAQAMKWFDSQSLLEEFEDFLMLVGVQFPQICQRE